MLTINKNGIDNKKVIPKASDALLFPMWVKTENIIKSNAIITPIENTFFTLIKLLITNK